MTAVVKYVIGADRNNPNEARAHYYALTVFGRYYPMCGYGWNRSNGNAFSILRGHTSKRGVCKTCQKRTQNKERPKPNGFEHKTR